MKVAVGISGGVDSAVTALLLQSQGYEVVGVTMTLGRDDEAQSLVDARNAAKRLNIQLKEFDFSAIWHHQVCEYIEKSYSNALTPNPCVRCNEMVKFSLLPQAAFDMGCDYFATGHYARTESGRLFRGVDYGKDQSYFLYRVDKEVLKRTLFPLGGMYKREVVAYANEHGLIGDGASAFRKMVNESQDFCGGDVKRFIKLASRRGEVVRSDGKVIGYHDGFWNFTVGQRKGIGIGGGVPFFVLALDAVNNRVVVGPRDEAICHKLCLTDTVGRIDMSLPVKVRSAGEPRLLSDGILGIAPGQSAVFYDGDELVGGGIIK